WRDEHDPAAGTTHPPGFGKKRLRCREMLEHVERDDDVEALCRKRKRDSVIESQLHVGAKMRGRKLDRVLRDLDSHVLGDAVCEYLDAVAVAESDLEHTGLARRGLGHEVVRKEMEEILRQVAG